MAQSTSPDGIVYPEASDPIAPLNAVFQDLAESVQDAFDSRFPTASYQYVDTVTFASSGTFTKADYPWLRAIRVRVQGAGGAGGGCQVAASSQCSMGSGGGAGGYAEAFITDIAGLASSVTVTRGAGGLGVVGASGNNGASSTFGGLLTANGGTGGFIRISSLVGFAVAGGGGGSASGTVPNRFSLTGAPGAVCFGLNTLGFSGVGGSAIFSGGGAVARITTGSAQSLQGISATIGGGGGGAISSSTGGEQRGGHGGDAFIVVDLFA